MKTAQYDVSILQSGRIAIVAYDLATLTVLAERYISPGQTSIDALMKVMAGMVEECDQLNYETPLPTIIDVVAYIRAHETKQEVSS